MEISAAQAFPNLRGLQLFTFVYSADGLDQLGWDKRILGNLTLDERIEYFLITKHNLNGRIIA